MERAVKVKENLDQFFRGARVTLQPSTSPVPVQHRIIGHLRNLNGTDTILVANRRAEYSFLNALRTVPPLFISYYTTDPIYESHAKNLRRSLDRFALPHRIEPRQSLGSWVANTGLKSKFIYEKWIEHDGPICWLDADSEVERVPSALLDNPFDLSIVRRAGWYDMSGLVFFNKTPAAELVLKNWVALCERNPNIWDQALLSLAWHQANRSTEVSSFWLNDAIFQFPKSVIRSARDHLIFYPLGVKLRPYIRQKQASRFVKARQHSNKGTEIGSENITEGFRSALLSFNFDSAYVEESAFDQ